MSDDHLRLAAIFGRITMPFAGYAPPEGRGTAAPLDRLSAAFDRAVAVVREFEIANSNIQGDHELSDVGRVRRRAAAARAALTEIGSVRASLVAPAERRLAEIRNSLTRADSDPGAAAARAVRHAEIRARLVTIDPLGLAVALKDAAERGDTESIVAVLDAPRAAYPEFAQLDDAVRAELESARLRALRPDQAAEAESLDTAIRAATRALDAAAQHIQPFIDEPSEPGAERPDAIRDMARGRGGDAA